MRGKRPTADRVLIVEDDVRLAELLTLELGHDGYRTTVAHTGTDALLAAVDGSFALIVLDLNLPDLDGIEVAERLRDSTDASIVMLTARGDVNHRVAGLYAGASDYLTKPFSIHELLARVHATLRDRGEPRSSLRVGTLELDPASQRCTVAGALIDLTHHEWQILELLLRNRGGVFSRYDLERHIYAGDAPASNTVEVFVSKLRRKLADAGEHDLIRTVRGLGYVVP